MSEHTPGRLEVLDDRRISVTLPPLMEGCGYTSHCVAMAYGGDERVNSHANARRLAASWNACDGFETDLLENIVMTGGTLKSRFALRTQEERESKAERDSLRAVNAELLEALEWVSRNPGAHHSNCQAVVDAAIASARKQGEPHG